MQTMTIIVPCYNEEEALPYFYEEISKIRQQLTEISLKLLFINDGSTDNTLATLKKLASSDNSVYYISFSRNFGKEAAIYAGLKNSTSDYTAIMDADLQDPPSLLPSMLHAILEEGYDSVATRRVNRKGEPPVRSFFARMFYKLIRKMPQLFRGADRRTDSLLQGGQARRQGHGRQLLRGICGADRAFRSGR